MGSRSSQASAHPLGTGRWLQASSLNSSPTLPLHNSSFLGQSASFSSHCQGFFPFPFPTQRLHKRLPQISFQGLIWLVQLPFRAVRDQPCFWTDLPVLPEFTQTQLHFLCKWVEVGQPPLCSFPHNITPALLLWNHGSGPPLGTPRF